MHILNTINQVTNKMKNINWKNHKENLIKTLSGFEDRNFLQDVTLVGDDQLSFKAHRLILSACSPILKDILKHVNENETKIFFTGINHDILKSLLKYMYHGETILEKVHINQFLNIAKELKLDVFNKCNSGGDNISEVEVIEEDDEVDVIREINIAGEAMMNNKKTGKATQGPFNNKEPSFKHISSENIQRKQPSAEFRLMMEVTCDECGQTFASKRIKIMHMESLHMEKRFTCDKCDYKTSLMVRLKKHLKLVHQLINCNHCDFKTSGKRNMSIHEKIHTL